MTQATLERRGQPELDVKKAEPDDLKLWSVTTILGVLDKPALLYWAAEQTANAAVAVAKSLPARVEEEGAASVVKWLRDARFRRPKDQLSDTEFGTQVHKLCEEYALTGAKPEVRRDVFLGDFDAAVGCLEQFDKWLQEWSPEYLATECTVYSPSYGVAGTCDGFMVLDGARVIFDYKSSKKSYGSDGKPTTLYPEVALQLAAYRHSEMAALWRPRHFESFRRRLYLLSEAERQAGVPVPEVDGGIGIKITPEHATAYPVRCDQEVYESFLYVLEAARWQFDLSKTVLGSPLERINT